MSQLIPDVFQQAYDAEVKRAYGQKMLLRNLVYLKTGVEGEVVHFRKKGKGLATPHVRSGLITPMNVEYSHVTAKMQDYDAFDYVDKLDIKKFNFSEAKETAEVCSDAIGLRMDQIVLDAIAAGYDTNNKIGTGSAALTVANLISAAEIMNAAGVPTTDRIFLHTAKQLSDLLGDEKATSTDYAQVKALMRGEIDTFMGFKFVLIANRDEGGLPHDSSKVTGFVYDKRAVGLGIGQDIQTRMDWIGDRSSWLIGGDFSAGAAVIDKEGVVAIQTKA